MSRLPRPLITLLWQTLVSLLAAVALALWALQLTYPAWPALLLLLTGAMLLWYRPAAWLVVMPALWPIIDLVPSTGRMYFAESDALAVLCIGMLGLQALRRPAGPVPKAPSSGPGLGLFLLLAGIALSYVISSIQALSPLPALDDNAFVGYGSPYNALRLSKGLLWALLLLPHWLALRCHAGKNAETLLRIGMTLGLTTASLAALWDRVAFNALLDFASDYRTTGLFWEMHVGGAALDGWLMLTLPFAVAGLLGAKRPLAITVNLAVLGLAAYAILTTFSRGVYLGCAVMLLVALPAWWRRRRERDSGAAPARDPATNHQVGALMFSVLAAAAVPVFHGGGYRGLAAMFAASGVAYLAGGLLRPMPVGAWLQPLGAAVPLVAISYLLHDQFPKAAYWLFGAALMGSLASGYLAWKRPGVGARSALAAFAAWCAAGTGWVCWHWGGDAALPGGLIASGLLFLALVAQTVLPRPIWRLDRSQTKTVTISSLVALMLAVGASSYFIGERFSTVGQDFDGRLQHWRKSIALIDSDREWALGIGVGRYATRYGLHAAISELPGAWRIAHDGAGQHRENDNAFLQLIGPSYPMGFNELLRVSQRVGLNLTGTFSVILRARAPMPVRLNLEVCQKHLLYPGDCAVAPYVAVPGGNKWTEIQQQLPDKPLAGGGLWAAPAITNFSIANDAQGKPVDIDDIELRDAQGNSLLSNGDFAHGADRWFFSSDRVHLPYHAKNMALHLLIEQGVFGMLMVSLACLTALWRLGLGRARNEEAAPALLAALAGFLSVGLFDSLLDVPRDSVFFYLLLSIALAMRAQPPRAARQGAAARFSDKAGGGGAPVARPAARRKRVLLGSVILLALPGIGLWATYQYIGRTPGEFMDYIDKRLQDWPRTAAIAAPAISTLRRWLDVPSLEQRLRQRFVIPPPPPVVVSLGDLTTPSGATEVLGRTLQVGPTALIRTIAEAARLARDGDVVEIQAGEYHGDVALWNQKKLTIRGVGGHARLYADGKSAEDKAIWVIRDGRFNIANIDFIGAHVADRNGAGIRFGDGLLRVDHCLFYGNETGILTTSEKARLEIYSSEFAYNGAGDGQSHNLYVGAIASLRVEGSYFHHANRGHLIKSRAAENHILYNRLTDESGGRASYELELPNGGVAYLIGNIIEQSSTTENSIIISFGAEGYKWPKNELYLINNTIDNNQPWGGTFLTVKPGAGMVRAFNNLLIGKGSLDTGSAGVFANNRHVGWEHFVLAPRHDYHIRTDSPLQGTFVSPGSANGLDLAPTREYDHRASTRALTAAPTLPGAQQTSHPDPRLTGD